MKRLVFLAVLLVAAMAAASPVAAPAAPAKAKSPHAKLCAKSWDAIQAPSPDQTSVLQTETGGSFFSAAECASAPAVFQPSLEIKHRTLLATGFHANEQVGVYLGGFPPPGECCHEIPYFFTTTTDSQGAVLLTHGGEGEPLGPQCRGKALLEQGRYAIVIDSHGLRADISRSICT